MSDWNPKKPGENYFDHPACSGLAEATQLESIAILDHLTYLGLGEKWARKAVGNEAENPEVRESARKLVDGLENNDQASIAQTRFNRALRSTMREHVGEDEVLSPEKSAELLERLVPLERQVGLPPLRNKNGQANRLAVKEWGEVLEGYQPIKRVDLEPLLEDFFVTLAKTSKGKAPSVSGMSYEEALDSAPGFFIADFVLDKACEAMIESNGNNGLATGVVEYTLAAWDEVFSHAKGRADYVRYFWTKR